ncbi:MAG: hypothetical protein AAB739_03845 [Patescibacteria group bacterium]
METQKITDERRKGEPLSEGRASQLVMGIKRSIDVWGEDQDACNKHVRDRMLLELRKMLSVVLHTLKIDELFPEPDPAEAFRKSLQFRKDDSLSKIRGLFMQACDLCMEKDMADGPEQCKDSVKDQYGKQKEVVLSEKGFINLICMLGLDDGKHGGRRDIF